MNDHRGATLTHLATANIPLRGQISATRRSPIKRVRRSREILGCEAGSWTQRPKKYNFRSRRVTVLTSSSVSVKPSCSTRDLTAFQPVKRCPIETYRVNPKSSGLRISYVDGLFRMALAWMPALCVKAQYPLSTNGTSIRGRYIYWKRRRT